MTDRLNHQMLQQIPLQSCIEDTFWASFNNHNDHELVNMCIKVNTDVK